MNTDKYTLGVYVEGGDWPHVDCYGLVLEVRRDLGLPAGLSGLRCARPMVGSCGPANR